MKGRLLLSVVVLVAVICWANASWTCNQAHDLLFEDSCYYFHAFGGRGFEQMEHVCQKSFEGGHLASIHSQKENDALTSYNSYSFAVGLHKVDGKWVWSDGTPVDYVNWKNPDEDDDELIYVYVSNGSGGPENGKWVKKETFTVGDCQYWCKYPATRVEDETTTQATTITAPTTTDGGAIVGCSLHTRDQCQEKDNVLAELQLLDPIYCQHHCNSIFSERCRSFKYNAKTLSCILYSDPIGEMSTCRSVGGPNMPSIKTCQSHGCKDFYRSDCEDDYLEPDTVTKDVDKVEDCEAMCHQSPIFCSKWVLDGTTCKLYENQKPCDVIHGPQQPLLAKCI